MTTGRRAGLGPVLAAALLACFGAPLPVAAQTRANDGCVLDHCADRKPLPAPGAGAGPASAEPAPPGQEAKPPGGRVFGRPTASAGNFDFYVLALSWSSGYCASGGADKSRDQCRPGGGLGFVVHGLWPQFEQGFPSDCDPSTRPPSRQALDAAKGLYPDEGLARHEWRVHGTCSGRSPADYFADVRTARDQVKIPDQFARLSSEEQVAPAEIMRAFTAANPRLRPNMLAVVCGKGVLQEVRVCLSKDLREFRPCAQIVRNSCRARDIRVPPVL